MEEEIRETPQEAEHGLADNLFGQIAVSLKYLTPEQLKECLLFQQEEASKGERLYIGQVMLRKGYITSSQFMEILKIQQRFILQCPGCKTRYNIAGYKPGDKFRCRMCAKILIIPPKQETPLSWEDIAADMSIIPTAFTDTDLMLAKLGIKLPVVEGVKLGKYKIIDLIGRGGAGVIFKAVDENLQLAVALKILKETGNEFMLKRFLREAQTASKLKHQNIVTIYETDTIHGIPYISMELIDGKPLDVLMAEKALSTKDFLRIMIKVSRAIDFAHKNGIIHRDIKPSNILIDNKGEPIITDFGLAKSISGAEFTDTGITIGTPYYMSPEQVRGREVDHLSDIYGLGIILFEFICGRPPFIGQTAGEIYFKILHEDLPTPESIKPDVDKKLALIAMKAIQKEKEKRYPSAEELAQDLENYLLGEKIAAKPPGVFERCKKFIKKNIILTIVSLSMIITAGFVFLIMYLLKLQAPPTEFKQTPRKISMSFHIKPQPVNIVIKDIKQNKVLQTTDEKIEILSGDYLVSINFQNDSVNIPLSSIDQDVKIELEYKPVDGMILILTDTFHFYIDKYEVTNKEYMEFLNSLNSPHLATYRRWLTPQYFNYDENGNVSYSPNESPEMPVRCIYNEMMIAYARFKQKRPVLIEEFLKASKGFPDWLFPWGNDKSIASKIFSYSLSKQIKRIPEDKSVYDVYDLAGSVYEIAVNTNFYTDLLTRGEMFCGLFQKEDGSFEIGVREKMQRHAVGFRLAKSYIPDSMASIEQLLKIYKDPNSPYVVRIEAFRQLMNSKSSREIIEEGLKDKVLEIKYYAIKQALSENIDVIDVIKQCPQAEQIYMLYTAALLGHKESFDYLKKMQDVSSENKLSRVIALTKLGDTEMFFALIHEWHQSQSQGLKNLILVLLSALIDSQDVLTKYEQRILEDEARLQQVSVVLEKVILKNPVAKNRLKELLLKIKEKTGN